LWTNGKPLRRHELHAYLVRAAIASGQPPSRFGSHSLRFGGASALWAAYHDSALVKRWGRRASDCFHQYLWESRKGAEGVAEAMASVDLTPTLPAVVYCCFWVLCGVVQSLYWALLLFPR
jgi:hypothetical protein